MDDLEAIRIFKITLDDFDPEAVERIIAYLTCYSQQRLETKYMFGGEEE